MAASEIGGHVALDADGSYGLKIILSVDPIKYPLTGIGRYTFELAKALACNDQVASLLFFHGLRLGQTLPKVAVPPSVLIALFSKLLKNRISFAAYRRIVPRAKGMALRGFEDYVYHGPNYYLPPFGGRSVVTIHDLSTYSLSACHPPARVRHMQEEITSTLSRATILLTDSEFTRQEVATHFGWPLAKRNKRYVFNHVNKPHINALKLPKMIGVIAIVGMST